MKTKRQKQLSRHIFSAANCIFRFRSTLSVLHHFVYFPHAPNSPLSFRWQSSEQRLVTNAFTRPQPSSAWTYSVACFGGALLIAGNLAIATAAQFFPMGDLPGGSFQSRAFDVSDDGSVVVGESTGAMGVQAVRWTVGGGIIGIGDLSGGDFDSHALSVSGDGTTIVGRSSSDAGEQAFRWTAGSGIVGLGDLAGGGFWSSATGVSTNGSVIVGGGTVGEGLKAYHWTAENGMTALGYLPNGQAESWASAVSADGSMTVGTARGQYGGYEAFVSTTPPTILVGLGDPVGGSFGSYAYGISGNGTVVFGQGASAFDGNEACYWTSATGWVGLGTPSSAVWSSTADGSLLVGEAFIDGVYCAYIWDRSTGLGSPLEDYLSTNHGLVMGDWHLSVARGISADGRALVGYGTNANGETEGWVIAIPEPSMSIMCWSGVLLILWRKR